MTCVSYTLGTIMLLVGGSTAAAGCMVTASVMGCLTVAGLGALVAVKSCKKMISKSKMMALTFMSQHLPRVLSPKGTKLLQGAGDEVKERLLAKLGKRQAWRRFDYSIP